MSAIAMRNARVDFSGSNTTCCPNVECSKAIASRTGFITARACGVGSMPREVRTKSGSLKMLRSFASAMLIEGWVMPIFAAARDTLPVL